MDIEIDGSDTKEVADDEPTQEQLAEIEKEGKEEVVDPDAFAPELKPISIYLHGLRKNPLLTPGEEIELSKQIDPFRKEYIALFGKIEKVRMHVEDRDEEPTQEEINHLEILRQELKKYDDNKEFNKAVNDFIIGNLRLVVSIAKHYMAFMPLLECISIGNLGLRKAAIKFDWEMRNKFATYATWWIRQFITREISDKKTLVRIPVHHTEALGKLGEAVTRLKAKGNFGPTAEEVAEEMNLLRQKKEEKAGQKGEPIKPAKPITARQVKYWRESGRFIRCVELHAPVKNSEDGDTLVEEGVSDTDTEGKRHTRGQDADLVDLATRQIAERLFKTLDPRTEEIMRERFIEGKTLDAVGEKLDLTRERIRQIQKKTLGKLLPEAKALYNGEDDGKS